MVSSYLIPYNLAQYMEQLCHIIQQIYSVLNILSLYSQDEREELVVGYQCFLFDINDVLIVLDRIVEGSTHWGWKINWGCQLWVGRIG